ncbi:MAG: oxidoreductase-like domain-containing protein [Metallibacterium sp.]
MFGEESPQSRAPRPQPPSAPGDCCGGGCTLCIDLHEQALQRYQQQLAAGV